MNKFIEFFGSAHLNNKNVSAYENKEGCVLFAENVENGKKLGSIQFDSYENAESWFSALAGSNNVSRLDSAIESLCGKNDAR